VAAPTAHAPRHTEVASILHPSAAPRICGTPAPVRQARKTFVLLSKVFKVLPQEPLTQALELANRGEHEAALGPEEDKMWTRRSTVQRIASTLRCAVEVVTP
jgi:hypothetical protein